MKITEKMVHAGATVQYEIMNGKRPTDPDKYDSPEDFVERLKWWDNFYKDAYPRYVEHFRAGLKAAIRQDRRRKK